MTAADVEQVLKPCPCCGGAHDQHLFAHGFGNYSVQCPHCRLNTGQKRGQQAAITAWNTRPIESRQRAEIEGLTEGLTKIRDYRLEEFAAAMQYGRSETVPTPEDFAEIWSIAYDVLKQKDPAP
jgi:hypothetical protein